MYPIKKDKVYVLNRVYDNPKAVARMERMLAVIQPKQIIKINDKGLRNLVKSKKWTQGHNKRTGSYHRRETPDLIFNVFRWNEKEISKLKRKYPLLRRALFLGQDAFTWRSELNHHGPDLCICQGAYEMHSIYGCLHACTYCHVEDFVNIMLNLEELAEHIPEIFEKKPSQKLFKYDNLTDTPCFEPEYGASEVMVKFFAKQPDKYLLLYTKSDNVDHLLDLPHNGHTIINWSISGDSQSKLIEKETPPFGKRVIAMEKCQKAGYTVRARFSPIIPIKNWKKEATEMIQTLLSRVKPDIITMDIIGFMSPETLIEMVGEDLLDEKALSILKDLINSKDIKKRRWGKLIFPTQYRKEMYDFFIERIRSINSSVPISICNENEEMWNLLESKLKMKPESYICCCGPDCVPGHPLL